MKTIEVTNHNGPFPAWGRPTLLTEYIAWLQKIAASIPSQYLEGARVEIRATEQYGDPDLVYEITYERPLTEAEEQMEKAYERHKLLADYEAAKICLQHLQARLDEA